MSPEVWGIRAKEIENEVLQNDYCLNNIRAFSIHNTDGLISTMQNTPATIMNLSTL
jgi:hypothetical protein